MAVLESEPADLDTGSAVSDSELAILDCKTAVLNSEAAASDFKRIRTDSQRYAKSACILCIYKYAHLTLASLGPLVTP